jgi:hypothetical protein
MRRTWPTVAAPSPRPTSARSSRIDAWSIRRAMRRTPHRAATRIVTNATPTMNPTASKIF